MEHLREDLIAYSSAILKASCGEEVSTEIKECIQKIQTLKNSSKDLLTAVLSKHDVILSLSQETDVEGCFATFIGVALTLDEVDQKTIFIQLLDAISSNTKDKAVLRLRIMTNVFNKLSSVALKFQCINKIIDYSANSDNLKLIYSYLISIDEVFDADELSATQRRSLYLKIANVLENSNASSIEVLKFLAKYLAAYQGANKNDLMESKAAAVRSVVKVIKSPVESFAGRISLVNLDAVKQLKDDKKSCKLFELLEIFSNKYLSEYLNFQKSNSDVLKNNDIDHESCVSNMRLLSLTSFSNRHEGVKYDEIMSLLQIEENEIENWVVQAITAGLIKGKIDQLERKITISPLIHRNFTMGEWKELSHKLDLWKKNIGSLLDIINRANTSSPN